MRGTIEKVRASWAFINTCRAMDIVFGPENWRVNTIWPDDNPDDYYLSVSIDSKDNIAYLSACRTYTGHDGMGPGGLVSVCVPIPGDPHLSTPGGPRFTFPDKVTGDTVDHVIGTPEEQKIYRWGADGVKVAEIVEYLHILKRYLDQQDESPSAGPPDSSTLTTASDS